MTALPQSPEELLELLLAIFPEYRVARQPLHDGPPTFHSVVIEFSTFFGGPTCSMSKDQLRSFGQLVSAAMEAGGPLENAFGTCLLEHAGQTGVWNALAPFLSKTAVEKSRA